SSPLFFFQRSRGHPALHSFPTRRSSDLALQVKAKVPEAVGVFILPPSRAALEERMRKRGQDSEEVIARRMANARGEMAHHGDFRSEEHTSELQSRENLVCRLLLEKKKQR